MPNREFLSWKARTLLILQLFSAHPKPTANPAERIAVEKEEQRHERALTFEKSRGKRYRACSDVVRLKGLEPTRIAAREPKGDVTLVKVFKWRRLWVPNIYNSILL